MLIDFSDYITITNNSVVEINEKGIRYKALKGIAFIDFSECAQNYQSLHRGNGKCVGEIDKTGSNHSLVFYTAPLTTNIFFVKEGNLMENEFNKVADKITRMGYTLSEAKY